MVLEFNSNNTTYGVFTTRDSVSRARRSAEGSGCGEMDDHGTVQTDGLRHESQAQIAGRAQKLVERAAYVGASSDRSISQPHVQRVYLV